MRHIKHIAIIGGGITGLSAAWELQKLGYLTYSMIEKENRWGGKVTTTRLPAEEGGAFIIDGGPESFITRKPELWQLAHELGIQNLLINPGSETSHIFVLTEGKPLPVPINPSLFITSPIMSTSGKLRMMAEPFISARRDGQDESLANFVTRRLGREALDRFIGPVLAGIYNTDPERQSILTTSPVMREMEAEYGSLVKAMIGRARKARANPKAARIPRFVTFQNGAEELVEALVGQLYGDLRLRVGVSKLHKRESGYLLELTSGEMLNADAVILSTPANVAASLLVDLVPEVALELQMIRHYDIGTATLVFRADDIHLKSRIHGLMVPRRERRAVDAITFTSLKMPARAPDGFILIRLFFGGSKPQVVELNDIELEAVLLQELKELFGIIARPVCAAYFRWPKSFPQAEVGHHDRLERIEGNLPDGIFLAGSSYRGIGVPDCIRQGRDAARLAYQLIINKKENKIENNRPNSK